MATTVSVSSVINNCSKHGHHKTVNKQLHSVYF